MKANFQKAESSTPKPKKKGCAAALAVVFGIILLVIIVSAATSHPWDGVASAMTSGDGKISEEKADIIAPVLYDLGLREDDITSAGKADKGFYYVTAGRYSYRINIRVSGDKVKDVTSLADPASEEGHTLYAGGKVKKKATRFIVKSDDKIAIETALDLYAESKYSAGTIDHSSLMMYKNGQKFVATGILEGQNAFGATLRKAFTASLTFSGDSDESAKVKSFELK